MLKGNHGKKGASAATEIPFPVPISRVTSPDVPPPVKPLPAVTEVISPKYPDVKRKVNAYQLQDGTIIWGATAMIISELEAILEEYPN